MTVEFRPAQGSTSDPTSNNDDAALLLLGRLLLVALAAGALIGGLTALLLTGWAYSGAVFFVGVLVGMPVALVVQLLNVLVLHLTRRVRLGVGRLGMRVALVPLPTLAALVVAAIFGNGAQDGSPSGVFLYLVPTALTAITAWAAGPWCLAPLFPPPDSPER